MLLEIGQIITESDCEYKVISLMEGGHCEYREVYQVKDLSHSKDYVFIVYSDKLVDHRGNTISDEEHALLSNLCGPAFEGFWDSLPAQTADGEPLTILKTSYEETISLRELIEAKMLDSENLKDFYKELIDGILEIGRYADSCHFNLNPDTVCAKCDEAGRFHPVIRGLNSVNNDFVENKGLNKSLISSDCRAPETNLQPFTPRAFEFSLAVLLIFMLQGRNPWSITPSTNGFRAYTAMRHNRPCVNIDGELGRVLTKAISIDPATRYELKDFITASLDCLGKLDDKIMAELRKDKASGGKGAKQYDSDKSGDGSIDDDDSGVIGPISCKDPQINIKISRKEGKGFREVAGMESLKTELQRDFVDIYHNPKLAAEYSLRIPSCIFFGPPGCGKTYIASKLAEEMGIDFTAVNPSDLGNIYVHGSQLMIRQLFDKAIRRAKDTGRGTLIFFDEVDALCPRRTVDDNNNQAGEVAEFLTQLNDLADKKVYVLAATNCMERVDPAILRSGRMDKAIYVGLPDAKSRQQLFEYELSRRPHDEAIDLAKLAEMTEGFTSSDISYIVNECGRLKFADVLRNSDGVILPIDQATLEKVISESASSVTKSDLAHYEEMKQQYANSQPARRRPVGFAV